jgi:hypothetical protein
MNDYACDCSVDVDGTPQAYKVGLPKARKVHVCCECGEPIQIGQQYEKTTALWDGHWETYKTCAPCLAMRNHYCPSGWYFGFLGETIQECLGWSPYEVPDVDEEEDR